MVRQNAVVFHNAGSAGASPSRYTDSKSALARAQTSDGVLWPWISLFSLARRGGLACANSLAKIMWTHRYLLSLLICLHCHATAAAANPTFQRYEFRQPHMGTWFTLKFYATDEATAKQAADAAFTRVRELNDRLSDYEPESELSRLSATSGTRTTVCLSRDLRCVLSHSAWLWRNSGGAFDVTAGPYIRLWRQARRTQRLPSDARLRQAELSVGFQHVRFTSCGRRVELLPAKMRLDLGGIAKGYAADEVLRLLRRRGIRRAMVDAGGDLALGQPPPGEAGWRIGVAPLDAGQPPSRVLLLSGCGVATSGDAFQHVVIDGTRYSHLLDPRTGRPLTTPSAVTVVARNCTWADGLASTLSVLGPRDGLKLIDQICGAAALVVQRDGEQILKFESRRASRLLSTKPPLSHPIPPRPGARGRGFR